MRLHAVAIVCLVALLPIVPAKAATIKLPYESPAVLGFQSLEDCEGAAGTVCLSIPEGAEATHVRVADATGVPVGGTWYLYTADGTYQAAGTYCHRALVPAGGGSILVVRVEAIGSPLNCGGAGGVPTRGVVVLQPR